MIRAARRRPIRMLAALLSATLLSARPASAQSADPVEWQQLVNAAAAGSAITKTSGCNGCSDAGGTSLQTIQSGDGYAEFAPVAGARLYAGLGSTVTASTDPALIDFAFSFWPDGGWDVRERNVYRTEGRFADGDVFRVSVEAGVVSYYKNGALVYRGSTQPTYPLLLDTTLMGAGASLSRAVLAVGLPPDSVAIATRTLPAGAVPQPYSATLAASGGSGTYVWTIAAGALPGGLALSTAGTIAGTPIATGTFGFTVRAADTANAANFAEQPLTLDIPLVTGAISVTLATIPPARIGEPYAVSLSASGGSGTYLWTLATGPLPPGVSLGSAGVISGIPETGGRFVVTVRAADAADPSSVDDQALTLVVLAATPPAVYEAVADRVARAKPALPALGAAGFTFADPTFGTRLMRVTDRAIRAEAPDASYRTPSGTHSNAWSADGRYFYVTSTDGAAVPFSFDADAMRATRLTAPAGGGLTLRFFNEPTFSYVTPAVLYGTVGGGNLRTVDQLDLETGVYTQLVDFDALVPDLAGTFIGGVGASAGSTERIIAFFGGAGQDQHFYLVAFDRNNPVNRRLLDTVLSTVDGVPANITLNFHIHAAAIDRSGRYVTVYPTGVDLQAPRNAAPAYVWDLELGTFTATPLVQSRSGGHDAYGYGYRVNQDCCTTSTWDAGQWQLRSLATPTTTTDLIAPVLLPKEVSLADHPSWHNAQPVTFVPFLDALYRYGTEATEWRAWDDEIIAVQTEAAGTGATVWRFAHHRSNVADDTDPTRLSFWYTPRINVSPDGRWALFTSNWEKTLGADPGAEVGGSFREDVFLIDLAHAAAPPPVSVLTTSLASGEAGTPYAAQLSASGGSGSFVWSIVSGALPAGLSLDASTGTISGTPVASGLATFTVRAADVANQANAGDRALSISIAPAPTEPVAITTTQLPQGRRGVWYSVTIGRSGGREPLTWSVAAGSLPPGLALDTANGTIAGTPSANGNWSFTIRVVDSAVPATSATAPFTIKVRMR